jgi:hypothetical protein
MSELSVPNTNNFSLIDVVAVSGLTSAGDLQQSFLASTDSFFDPQYKGTKTNLYNFRHYSIPGSSQPPTVTTTHVSLIGTIAANGNGNVTTDGGSPILQRGICWSTSPNPTTGNSFVLVAGTTGAFTGAMAGLSGSTLYYVKAFAKNINGLVYGNQLTFTTLTPVTYPYVWYLPSKDEFTKAYLNVFGQGKGNLSYGPTVTYWSSSEDKSQYSYGGNAWLYRVATPAGWNWGSKSYAEHVRPFGKFESTTVYALRAVVPGGPIVYFIDNLGGGNYRYWIVAPRDATSAIWSYPRQFIPSNSTAWGTGEANTDGIIAQATVTTAALIAKNFVL